MFLKCKEIYAQNFISGDKFTLFQSKGFKKLCVLIFFKRIDKTTFRILHALKTIKAAT
jgi:hypothetical protein